MGFALHVGSSGEGSACFRGDLVLLKIFRRQLDATERAAIAAAILGP